MAGELGSGKAQEAKETIIRKQKERKAYLDSIFNRGSSAQRGIDKEKSAQVSSADRARRKAQGTA
jgi:hypothetical protein